MIPPRKNKGESIVGVDVTSDEIRVVRLRSDPDNQFCIESADISPVRTDIKSESGGLAQALRETIKKVCDHPREARIWAVLGADQVRIHHLKVPAVSQGQLREAVYWAMQREESFVDAETIVDFEVEQSSDRKEGDPISVTGFLASRKDVEHLEKTFAEADFPLTGILLPLSAALNPSRALGTESAEPLFSFIHVGVHSSRVSIVEKSRARMTRTIPIGLNTLIDTLTQALEPRPTASEAEDLILQLDQTAEGEGRWKNEEVLAVLYPALERISRHIERTLVYYQTTYKSPRIERIHLEGTIANIPQIGRFIEDQIGTKLSPPEFLEDSGIQTDQLLPETGRERLALAFGAALSAPGRTPNLLCTWDDRERLRQGNRINRVIFSLFLAFVAACGTFYAWQQIQLRDLQQERDRLSRSVASSPDLNEAMVMAALGEAQQRQTRLREIAARYESVALLAEIGELTPPHIRLDNVSARLGTGNRLRMEGIVSGEQPLLETLLAIHAAQLEQSLLLNNVRIEESSFLETGAGIGLHFVLTMETAAPPPNATQ